MTSNYEQIKSHLANLAEFKGNSMSARWEGDRYCVYSYSTQIAEFAPDDRRWVSDAHYSVTTRRHQNLCRTYLPCAHTETHEEAGPPRHSGAFTIYEVCDQCGETLSRTEDSIL